MTADGDHVRSDLRRGDLQSAGDDGRALTGGQELQDRDVHVGERLTGTAAGVIAYVGDIRFVSHFASHFIDRSTDRFTDRLPISGFFQGSIDRRLPRCFSSVCEVDVMDFAFCRRGLRD